MSLLFHKIIKQWEGDSGGHLGQPPAQGRINPDQAISVGQVSITPVLKEVQG